MTKVIAIRPEPGLSATLEAAKELGMSIAGYPLSEIASVPWQIPDDHTYDGVLIGSANAVRHGGDQLAALRHLPVLAVGKTSAEAAKKAGFSVEKTGEGGLQNLLDGLDERPRTLLRLAGEEHVPLAPPAHIRIDTRVVYRLTHLAFSSDMVEELQKKPLVLLHSANAAKHFASECERLDIDRSHIALAAIGPRVLSAAGEGWRLANAADKPNDASLLASARYMCH